MYTVMNFSVPSLCEWYIIWKQEHPSEPANIEDDYTNNRCHTYKAAKAEADRRNKLYEKERSTCTE